MKPPSINEQIAELKRELAMRKQVYAKQVNLGRMSREKANKQYIALKYAIKSLEAYRELKTGKQETIF